MHTGLMIIQCDLCKAWPGKKDLGKYYILICNTCHVPMIVLREHRASVTKEEWQEVDEIRKKLYPDRKLRKQGMRKILSHWHWHLV